MKKAIITAGPTREKIDPVRYLSNYSSGKQGYAIAAALVSEGVDVTLISGPVDLSVPRGVNLINVESAEEMLSACEAQLPADIAICTAAVCDWRAENISDQKMKKTDGQEEMSINLTKNPDILASLCADEKRPNFVVGFAAETENVIENAKIKIAKKGCDLILANDVSGGVLGGDDNQVAVIDKDAMVQNWPQCSKDAVAEKLVEFLSNKGIL